MGAADVRHYWSAEACGPHAGQLGRSDRRRQPRQCACDLEHLLRYSPIWRPADISARHADRYLVAVVERANVDCRLPSFCRGTWSDAHLRNTVALATCADELFRSPDCTGIR